MPPLFALTIVAPDHVVFEGRVQGLIAPGAEGYLGVLARHAPMVAQLGPGVVTVTDERGTKSLYAVSSGFAEVTADGVTVLADAAEAAVEIDAERARAAGERARQRLRERQPTVDLVRAEAALQRALARLKAVEKTGAGSPADRTTDR